MRYSHILSMLIVLFLALVAAPTKAFEPPETLGVEEKLKEILESLDDVQPATNQTINDFQESLKQAFFDAIDKARQESIPLVMNNTPAAVAGKTAATAPAEGFPEQVRESIADFLPLLGLSMDAVSTSEDRKSVTLKVRPLQFEHGAFNLTATAAEPAVFQSLLDEIIEPVREQEQKRLLNELDELDDVTLALSFGYRRAGVTWSGSRKLYGRDFSLYQDLIDDLLVSSWDTVEAEMSSITIQADHFRTQVLDSLEFLVPELRIERKQAAAKAAAEAAENAREEAERTRTEIAREKATLAAEIAAQTRQEFEAEVEAATRGSFNPMDTTFAEIRDLAESGRINFSVENVVAKVKEDALLVGILDQKMNERNFDALPSLVDNQPQLVFTLTHRAANEIIGPEATTLTARYEMGSKNINAMLREYHRLIARNRTDDQARVKAYDTVVRGKGGDPRNEDKLIFSISYKRIDDHNFEHPYPQTLLDPETGDAGTTIDRTATVTLPRSEEWRGSLTFTRFILVDMDESNQTGVELPRVTATLEAVELRDDPMRQNRIIAKVSYVQPVRNGMSVPITLTWASRPEFLGEQDRRFGAHLGLTYKVGSRRN